MPKRIRREPEPDVNQLAHHLVKASTETKGPVAMNPPAQSEISRVMAEMGRRGGMIGGKRRAERMTVEQRSESASKAAKARWDAVDRTAGSGLALDGTMERSKHVEAAARRLATLVQHHMDGQSPAQRESNVRSLEKATAKIGDSRAKSATPVEKSPRSRVASKRR